MPNLEPQEQESANGKLTEKQIRFCEEFLIDLNATQAAIRAGYSKKTAQQISSHMLLNVVVQKRIAKLRQRQSAKAVMTSKEVLEELSIIGRSSIEHYMRIDEDTGSIIPKSYDQMPKDSVRAIQSIEENRIIKEDAKGDQVTVYDKVKFKLHPKVKALEWLGKYHTLFEDKEQKQGEIVVDNRNLNFTVVHINGRGENVGESLKELKKMSDEVIKGEVVDKGNNK